MKIETFPELAVKFYLPLYIGGLFLLIALDLWFDRHQRRARKERQQYMKDVRRRLENMKI